MWNANIFALTLFINYVILLFCLEGRLQFMEQMFWEFLCNKMYKNNCLTILKIYVRIFIQCININCRNFQIIQKTLVLYRFKSLHFSELKRKGVKRVFYIPQVYPPRGCWKIFQIFFIFVWKNVFEFWNLILKNFNWLKYEFFLFCFNKLNC